MRLNRALPFRFPVETNDRESWKPHPDVWKPLKWSSPVEMESLRDGPGAPCKWPVGESAPFKFCGAPATSEKPYCEDHCGMAYKKVEK